MGLRKSSFAIALFTLMIGAVGIQAQFNPRVSETQVRTLLQRLETRTDTFRATVNRRLDNSNLNNTRREDKLRRTSTRLKTRPTNCVAISTIAAWQTAT